VWTLVRNLASIAIAVMFASTAQASILFLTGSLDPSQVATCPGACPPNSTAAGLATVTIDTVLETITTDLRRGRA
jgi:hypothetical protein